MKRLDEQTAPQLWVTAQAALRAGKLKDAKDALDVLGQMYDDACSRLETEMLRAGLEGAEQS